MEASVVTWSRSRCSLISRFTPPPSGTAHARRRLPQKRTIASEVDAGLRKHSLDGLKGRKVQRRYIRIELRLQHHRELDFGLPAHHADDRPNSRRASRICAAEIVMQARFCSGAHESQQRPGPDHPAHIPHLDATRCYSTTKFDQGALPTMASI